jgi:hypothetical protein
MTMFLQWFFISLDILGIIAIPYPGCLGISHFDLK